MGLLELTNLVIPVMRKQSHGLIINISSVLGLVSLPYRGAYNASKYAVEALSDAWRLELADAGINVVLIEPGPIKTEFRNTTQKVFDQAIDPQHSHHQAVYDAKREKRKQPDPFTLAPEAVVKKIRRAIESAHPAPRYFVTFPTHVMGTLKRLLPGRALDWVVKKMN